MPRELPRLIDRAEWLLELAAGRRVLHIGCANAPYTAHGLADGSLLHVRLRESAAELIGVDTDPRALELLADQGDDDLIHLRGPLTEQLHEIPPVDLIIAGEVIEHVDDAGSFLDALRTVMVRDGAELALTTVNAYCALRAVQYAWPRAGRLSEPVHPDHVAYYSLRTLGLLCARHQLTVEDEAFYDLGAEHRVGLPRRHRVTNDVIVHWLPQLADGIVVRCRVAPEATTPS